MLRTTARAIAAVTSLAVLCPAWAGETKPKKKLKVEYSDNQLVLTGGKKSKERTYYQLKPGGWIKVLVEGPGLMNVRIRQLLDKDGKGAGLFTVSSVRNDEYFAELQMSLPPDPKYRLKGWRLRPSKLKKVQLEIPEGEHVYRLTVSDEAKLGLAIRITRAKKKNVKALVHEEHRPPVPPLVPVAKAEPAAKPEPKAVAELTTKPAAKPEPGPVVEPKTKPKTTAAAAGEVDVKKLKPLRVVLYDLNASGLDEKLVGLITESLLTEIRKLRKVSVMGMAEIGALLSLEEQKQLLGCDDGACLVEIAGALGGDNLVVGNLGKMGENLVLSVKRLDMRTTNMISSWNKTIKGSDNEEALLGAIGPSVETLFTEYPLRPGFKRGVSPELAKRLNPPPLPTWVFWLTASGAAAAGLASGGMKVWHHQEVVAYNHKARESEGGRAPVSASELADIEDNVEGARNAYIGLAAAAGALALTAGLEALFTDWWGYGDEPPKTAPIPASGPRDATASASVE